MSGLCAILYIALQKTEIADKLRVRYASMYFRKKLRRSIDGRCVSHFHSLFSPFLPRIAGLKEEISLSHKLFMSSIILSSFRRLSKKFHWIETVLS